MRRRQGPMWIGMFLIKGSKQWLNQNKNIILYNSISIEVDFNLRLSKVVSVAHVVISAVYYVTFLSKTIDPDKCIYMYLYDCRNMHWLHVYVKMFQMLLFTKLHYMYVGQMIDCWVWIFSFNQLHKFDDLFRMLVKGRVQ